MDPYGNLTYLSNNSDSTHVNNYCPVIFPGNFPTTSGTGTIVLCVVNVLSSFTATTLNVLVLWAIRKTPSLHTPSSVLLFALALSDLATGAFVQPLLFTHLVGVLTYNFTIYCTSGAILYPVGSSLVFVSFSAITAISFDRYLALVLHLRYATIITVSRVIKFNISAFVLLFPVAVYFWFSQEDWFKQTALCIGVILAVIGIIAIPFSYCCIFAILRRHQKQIQNQINVATRMHGISHMDISKYRKSVLTILYILAAILLSYLPCGISYIIALFLKTEVSEFVLSVGGVLVLLNSSINPLVYCWRIKEIRRFVLSKLWQVFGFRVITERAVWSNRRVGPVMIADQTNIS